MLKTSNSTYWFVASILKIDGHKFDGYFVTDNVRLLRSFANDLCPLVVNITRFEEEKDARDLVLNFHSSLIEINCKDWPDRSTAN